MQKDKESGARSGFNRMFVAIVIAIQLVVGMRVLSNKDDALMPYYNETLSIVRERCTPDQYFFPKIQGIRFYNAPEDSGEIAICESNKLGFRIGFDRASWAAASEADRKQVMAHEVVHCLFNQDHVQDAENFMAPYFARMDEAVLLKQLDEYLSNKCGPK